MQTTPQGNKFQECCVVQGCYFLEVNDKVVGYIDQSHIKEFTHCDETRKRIGEKVVVEGNYRGLPDFVDRLVAGEV